MRLRQLTVERRSRARRPLAISSTEWVRLVFDALLRAVGPENGQDPTESSPKVTSEGTLDFPRSEAESSSASA